MDHPIAILTDSTCDIPEPMIRQYGITILPQILLWGEQVYRDRVDITPEDFYQRLESSPVLPTTTQPSPADFEQVYRKTIAEGAKEIIMLTVSSAMSGTFQLAKKIASQMEIPVHVVDAKGPTMSLGWQVLAAARARIQGANAQQILQTVDEVRRRLVQIVCLDTLEFLYRGGRIGNATRLVGSLLNLKPLVQINHETGLVESSGQARTRRKSIEMLVQRFFELLQPGKLLHVAVLHGNAPEEAAEIAGRIQAEHSPAELLVNITGPVLGINTGPRALALCGYAED